MKFKLVAKKNPMEEEAPPKFYPIPINSGVVDMDDFTADLAGRSSLTRGDIENVLSQFLDRLPYYLRDGKTVALVKFGKVRLTLVSNGADSEDEFHVSMIKGVRIIFTPDVRLKKEVSDIHYERVNNS